MNRLRLNISGRIFELYEHKVRKWPLSLLANRSRRDFYFDSIRDEYYFDRNAESFEGILYFYQSHGKLQTPEYVSVEIFFGELQFFGLDKYIDVSSATQCDQRLISFYSEIVPKIETPIEDVDEPESVYKRYIWRLFEYPNDTRIGLLVNIISLICTIVSIIALCAESYVFQTKNPTYIIFNDSFKNQTFRVKTKAICYNRQINEDLSKTSEIVKQACIKFLTKRDEFLYLECICNLVFTVELILRLVSSKTLKIYFKNLTNSIDFIVVTSFWIFLASNFASPSTNGLSILILIRLTRLLRILRFSSQVKTIQIFVAICKDCLNDVYLLILVLATNIILFSSALYFIELNATHIERNQFISIPHAFWWSIISFTSIGYGDMIPVSYVGKMFGCLFVIMGIMVALLPVPILASKFEKLYTELSRLSKKK